jgi:peptidoglycan/LPS O-acetylase OafA/YrhL
MGYQPALDGLRAIAVVVVITFHYWNIPNGGAFGVDIFFVLSGFLISTLLIEEHRRFGSIDLRRFYARRALRLMPALYAMLVVFLATALLLRYVIPTHSPAYLFHYQLLGVLYAATYTTNLAVAAGIDHGRSGLSYLWTLGAEEQFYLLWPVLLVFALRFRKLLVASLCALAASGAIALVRYLLEPAVVTRRLDIAAALRFDSVLIGCALALAASSTGMQLLRRRDVSTLVPVVAVGVAAWLITHGRGAFAFYEGKSFAVALCTAAVIACVLYGSGLSRPMRRVLELPVLVVVGRLSYGLYLVHASTFYWLSYANHFHVSHRMIKISSLIATAILAVGSYYVVERRFLRLKWRLARVRSHDVPLGAALASAARARSPAQPEASAEPG